MKPFNDGNFLLQTETAQHLYHDHAAKMPIIDYQCLLIEAAEKLFNKVIAVCDGELLHHEKEGAKEIAIFNTGVTL